MKTWPDLTATLAATIALLLVLAPLPAAARGTGPELKLSALELTLPDPGKTTLAAGRYRLAPAPAPRATDGEIQAVLQPLAADRAGRPVRLKLHSRGCGGDGASGQSGVFSWGPGSPVRVIPRADGGRELRIGSRENAQCVLIALLLPAVQAAAAPLQLTTPPPPGDPPPPDDTGLRTPEKDPVSAPPRDQGDPGPQPMQREPGLIPPPGSPN